jgi:hypothetical protein
MKPTSKLFTYTPCGRRVPTVVWERVEQQAKEYDAPYYRWTNQREITVVRDWEWQDGDRAVFPRDMAMENRVDTIVFIAAIVSVLIIVFLNQ